MHMATYILFILLALASTATGTDDEEEVMKSFMQAYGTKGASKSYFSSHGKTLFEQAAMLDAMALAKKGRTLEASTELANLAIQTMLAELPKELQAVGGLMNVMQSNSMYFRGTFAAVRGNMDAMSHAIKQKLTEFKQSSSNTDEDKQRVQEEIKSTVAGRDAARQKIFDAWEADMERLSAMAEKSKPTSQELKAHQAYGKAKWYIKQIRFPPKMRHGPIADVIGLVTSGISLHNAIKQKNTKGIVKGALGIAGSVVGLSLFTAALITGIQALAVLNVFAGCLFFVVPLILEIVWPRSLAIETANKLTEISRNDLEGYQHQLAKFTESGARSFGWMYQANSGILVEKKIKPDTPIKFWQPSCATQGTTPCDPKTAEYEGKRYLVLGNKRQSEYTKPEFQLDQPYDFLGVPTEPKFCGNTISVNTKSFRQYILHLGRKFRSNVDQTVGRYHRNLEIDTRTVPNYNDVDFNQWRAKNQTVKRDRQPSQLDETEDIKCDPESDRISIDELAQLHPLDGKVTINTGAGKDLLSLNGMTGHWKSSEMGYLVVDLGDDGNMLSLGATINLGELTRDNVMAGVSFQNLRGGGWVCYVLDFTRDYRCVGNVKGVTIFKGSRFYNEVYIGPKGPFTIIQNGIANRYLFDVTEMLEAGTPDKPFRYEIMDATGNIPAIWLCSRENRVEYKIRDDGTIVIKLKSSGEKVAKIRVTGYVTEAEVGYLCW